MKIDTFQKCPIPYCGRTDTIIIDGICTRHTQQEVEEFKGIK